MIALFLNIEFSLPFGMACNFWWKQDMMYWIICIEVKSFKAMTYVNLFGSWAVFHIYLNCRSWQCLCFYSLLGFSAFLCPVLDRVCILQFFLALICCYFPSDLPSSSNYLLLPNQMGYQIWINTWAPCREHWCYSFCPMTHVIYQWGKQWKAADFLLGWV